MRKDQRYLLSIIHQQDRATSEAARSHLPHKRQTDDPSSSQCQPTDGQGIQTPYPTIHASERFRQSAHPTTTQWWSRTGSNRRPPACKAGALPTELRPLTNLQTRSQEVVGPGRLELPTSRLSGVRSNHLSYGPKLLDPRRQPCGNGSRYAFGKKEKRRRRGPPLRVSCSHSVRRGQMDPVFQAVPISPSGARGTLLSIRTSLERR